MQPPEGPPVWTALILPPSGAPPPISSTISLKEVPIGTSTSPVLRILPARAKTFVPLLFSVPIAANQSGPLRMMTGMLAKVSTLLMRVGFPQRPAAGGGGGEGGGGRRPAAPRWRGGAFSPRRKRRRGRRSANRHGS